jgi:RecA-family ATPase
MTQIAADGAKRKPGLQQEINRLFERARGDNPEQEWWLPAEAAAASRWFVEKTPGGTPEIYAIPRDDDADDRACALFQLAECLDDDYDFERALAHKGLRFPVEQLRGSWKPEAIEAMRKANRRADRIKRMQEKRAMTIKEIGNVISLSARKAREADAEVKFNPNFDDNIEEKDKLPTIELITPEVLDKQPVREIPYLVQDWIVEKALNGLFGDGGVGKDLMLMQLAFAMAYDRKWLGMDVKPGRVIYINVEDPASPVLRWRQEKIKEHMGIKFSDERRMRIVPMVGKQTVLAFFGKGLVQPTRLFVSLQRLVADFRPALIIVGNRVNIFSVNQNEDAQARQCLQLLNSLITDFGTTVIMPGHVSVRGNQPGSDGTSGSVQWSNGVRQRLLLRKPTTKIDDEDNEIDRDERILEVKKANWGPTDLSLNVRWQNHVIVAERENRPALGNVELKQQQDEGYARAEDEFIRLLDKAEVQKQNLSARPKSHNYAPKLFSEDQGCRSEFKGKNGRKKLAAAMDRLFEKKAIEAVSYGKPSDHTYRIARVEGWQPPPRKPLPPGMRPSIRF